jgi:uncharacterized phage protein gp47/JayE
MFTTPDLLAIRAAILRDIQNRLPEAVTGPDSDFHLRASAVAAAIEGLYQHQQWLGRQILPDTADGEFLERWASLFGLYRKPAATASGTITLTGTPGVGVYPGNTFRTADGLSFVVPSGGGAFIAANGRATVKARAGQSGAAGNITAGTALTLVTAISGVQSAAVAASDFSGGMEVESSADLLARLLDRLRNPPHGGNAADYRAWALEVPGVVEAYVFAGRRGVGTVDVALKVGGLGVPSNALLAQVQAYIDERRPVTADFLAVSPTQLPVNITAALTLAGTTLEEARASLNTALLAYFSTLKPGDTVIRNRLAAIIADTRGVVDFTLSAPAANVTTAVTPSMVQVARMNTLTLS